MPKPKEKQVQAKSASRLRGQSNKKSPRSPNPNRHQPEATPRKNPSRHTSCQDSSSPRFEPTTKMSERENNQKQNTRTGDERRPATSSGTPVRHSSPRHRKLSRRAQSAPQTLRSSPYLQSGALPRGDRMYLLSLAQAYSVANMKFLKQLQYEQLLYHQMRLGVYSRSEYDKYMRYILGPRKRPYGKDPSSSQRSPSPRRGKSARNRSRSRSKEKKKNEPVTQMEYEEEKQQKDESRDNSVCSEGTYSESSNVSQNGKYNQKGDDENTTLKANRKEKKQVGKAKGNKEKSKQDAKRNDKFKFENEEKEKPKQTSKGSENKTKTSTNAFVHQPSPPAEERSSRPGTSTRRSFPRSIPPADQKQASPRAGERTGQDRTDDSNQETNMDQSNDSGTKNEKPAKSPSKTEGNGRPKSRLGNRDKYSTKPIQNGTEPTSPKEEKQPVKVNRKPEDKTVTRMTPSQEEEQMKNAETKQEQKDKEDAERSDTRRENKVSFHSQSASSNNGGDPHKKKDTYQSQGDAYNDSKEENKRDNDTEKDRDQKKETEITQRKPSRDTGASSESDGNLSQNEPESTGIQSKFSPSNENNERSQESKNEPSYTLSRQSSSDRVIVPYVSPYAKPWKSETSPDDPIFKPWKYETTKEETKPDNKHLYLQVGNKNDVNGNDSDNIITDDDFNYESKDATDNEVNESKNEKAKGTEENDDIQKVNDVDGNEDDSQKKLKSQKPTGGVYRYYDDGDLDTETLSDNEPQSPQNDLNKRPEVTKDKTTDDEQTKEQSAEESIENKMFNTEESSYDGEPRSFYSGDAQKAESMEKLDKNEEIPGTDNNMNKEHADSENKGENIVSDQNEEENKFQAKADHEITLKKVYDSQMQYVLRSDTSSDGDEQTVNKVRKDDDKNASNKDIQIEVRNNDDEPISTTSKETKDVKELTSDEESVPELTRNNDKTDKETKNKQLEENKNETNNSSKLKTEQNEMVQRRRELANKRNWDSEREGVSSQDLGSAYDRKEEVNDEEELSSSMVGYNYQMRLC